MNVNPRRVAPVALLIVVAAVAVGVWMRDRDAAGRLEASGTVEATEVDLGFSFPGRLDSLAVDEGDVASAGQLLARLDLGEMLTQRDQAEARLASARALLREMTRGSRPEEVAQAKAAAKAASDRLEDADRDLKRATTLFDAGAVSREALDKATTAFEVAESRATEAREAYDLAEAGPRRERIDAQRAEVSRAEAAVAQIEETLKHMRIRAPFAGVVTSKHRDVGEIIPAGTPVLTLRDQDSRWVRIYVPEGKIGRVALGSRAEIRSDSDPKRVVPGSVVFIATQAEFTPRSVQTKEERVRLVYAVKVRVEGDPEYTLKPGMPADVTLDGTPRGPGPAAAASDSAR